MKRIAIPVKKGSVQIIHADCRKAVRTLDKNSIDAVVTDPPYSLVSIVKRFGADNAAPAKSKGATGVYKRASAGFMGQRWDTGETAHDVEFWKEIYRVLKPGGHLVAFGGTRTYHRMVCAIEDAGFEIRDMVAWLYGSGFPKSHDVSKSIDQQLGMKRERTKGGIGSKTGETYSAHGGFVAGEALSHDPISYDAGKWSGWGTALKPALEPIVLARKPLIGTVAKNVLKHGTGAINVDGCRVKAVDQDRLAANWNRETTTDIRSGNYMRGKPRGVPCTSKAGNGRWPANVVHDGSEEVVGTFPDSKSCSSPSSARSEGTILGGSRTQGTIYPGEDGSAARFFYTAKADKGDRNDGMDKGERSDHPTVKPSDLMQWLVRLVTPPNGTVLDPFMGSGSTGRAAIAEGFSFIGIEREEKYLKIAEARIKAAVKTTERPRQRNLIRENKPDPVQLRPRQRRIF